MKNRGNLFVVSAASGTGKSSLVKAIVQQDNNIKVSISHATRKPRGQEQNGREYYFVTIEDFLQMISQHNFLEWAQVHDNYYGTSKQAVLEQLDAGNDVILEIDVQGALQIKQDFPAAQLIFILPPNWEELKKRLQYRGEDAAAVIKTRLNNAQDEILYAKHFKFVIINDVFEKALAELIAIIQTQRLTFNRQLAAQPELFQTFNINNYKS